MGLKNSGSTALRVPKKGVPMRKKFNISLIMFLLIIVLVVSSCTSQSSYSTISSKEANKLLANSDSFLLDVRTLAEYSEGHIPNSTLIPHTEILANQDKLPTNKDINIIVYCRSGNRSKNASEELIKLGYKNVYNMAGGISNWSYVIEK